MGKERGGGTNDAAKLSFQNLSKTWQGIGDRRKIRGLFRLGTLGYGLKES